MQMMFNIMKNTFGVGAQKLGASTLGAHHLQNVLSVLGNSASGKFSIGGLLEPFVTIIEGLWGIIIAWFYFISKFVFQIVDLIQYVIYKLAGINLSSEITFDLPIFRILLSDTVLNIFLTLFIVGLILLIIFTIISIVKSEYEMALETDNSKIKKSASGKIVKSSLTATFLMLAVPLILIVVLAFGSVFLTSVNSVLNPNGTSSTTLGGQLFVASAHKANMYRNYAEKGDRIPIIYDFDDPYSSAHGSGYSLEDLEKQYALWTDGKGYYSDQKYGNYQPFSTTLVYKNNKIFNSESYSGYEQWVSTPEQYYIMADFIDYAVKNNLEFYIKNSSDTDIDWENTSTTIKLTDGVYDPATGTFKISYQDTSNINKYDDFYTLCLDANEFIASSPIADTTKTISELLGVALNTYDEENIDSKLFRILERVEGTTNVVKWKTESINYGDEKFTIYNLTKRYYNVSTGLTETRATIPVAKKQSAGAYYILKQNSDGGYEYTNQVIEYNNNGRLYLDSLEPIYVYKNWPEKLYNDLKVIYDNINIDNYINYDNWADMLGEYYSSGNATSEEVTTFATTLIHPLGLIMSELFLGVTMESTNGMTDYAFTTQYLEETIQALCFAVAGEENYWQLKCEIESFVDMFNGLFTPIIEQLKIIEGFDLFNEDEYSVQAYVYKAYLASMMLSDSAGDYFETLGYEILNLNNLATVIFNNSSNYKRDENGDIMYEYTYLTDAEGNYIKITFTQTDATASDHGVTGKYVYNVSGEKVVVCNSLGYASETDMFIPIGGLSADFVKFDEESGRYSIKYKSKFYNSTEYDEFYKAQKASGKDIPTWEALFFKYFELYYTVGYDHNRTFEYEGQNYAILCNGDGKIAFTNINGDLSLIDTSLKTSNGIYFVPKAGVDATIAKDEHGDLKYKVLHQGEYVFADDTSIVFEDFFEHAKARLYVYDHIVASNPNSIIDRTPASDVVISGEEDDLVDDVITFAIDYALLYSNASGNVSIKNESIIQNQIAVASNDYYLYQKVASPMYEYSYSTYEALPDDSKAVIDEAIEYLYNVSDNPNEINQTFLPYLELYKKGYLTLDEEDNIILTMDEILASPMINSSEVKLYEKDIKDFISYMVENQDKSSKRTYKLRHEVVCSYYKYKIIKAVQDYMSYRISSGYEVIVNGQSFFVEQALSSTQFMEIVFGNNLTYNNLKTQLEHGALYEDLTKFNKSAMHIMASYIFKDLDSLTALINKLDLYEEANSDIYNIKSYYVDFSLSDLELDLINKFYYVKTGNRLNATHNDMFNYLKKTFIHSGSYNSYMYDNIVNALRSVQEDMSLIVSRYMDKDNDISSTTDCETNLEATKMLARYVASISSKVELTYTDPNFTGIIDSNGIWGTLRSFLKEFGKLCFDLNSKSTFNSLVYGKTDSESFLDRDKAYVSELLDMLNQMLSDVDFGSATTSITKITGYEDLVAYKYDEETNTYEYFSATGNTTYSDLTTEAKYLVSVLCDYFEKTTQEMNEKLENAEDAYNMLVKFKNGRYTLQPNSLIYTTFVNEYLEYFKYNVDSSDIDQFINYVYDDYYTEVDGSYFSNLNLSDADCLNYYFKYLDAFENFNFSNSGDYYSNLTSLQQQVINDCLEYFKKLKDNAELVIGAEYAEAQEQLAKLNSFVFGNESGEMLTFDASGVADIIGGNLEVINLYNILDFLGLEFKANKELRDYRIDAMRELVEFSELSGESSASIQSRFLALLYLACSDYTENSEGKTYIGYDDNSKQIILSLAGIQDRAEELLVDLEYEGNFENSVADEKYGSIFIICTYNEETEMYEPFIFASGADKFNTPYSTYYKSIDNQITYYPIIAKGILDERGRPTAIREINGFIEFYREEVYKFSLSSVSLDVYTVTEEDVSKNYGVVGRIVSSIKNAVNMFLVADTLSDKFEYVDISLSPTSYYGTRNVYEYHLDGGKCNLNYMFYESSGITVGHLYNISQLNIVILLVASVVLLKAMWNVLYGVVGSIFQIAILFAVYPVIVGAHPLKKNIKGWVGSFTKQFFIMYGYIVALNSYFILLILIDQMGNILPSLSESSLAILDRTFIFNSIDVWSIVSFLLSTTLLLVATTMLDSVSGKFSGDLFGSTNVAGAGKNTKNQMDAVINEAQYFHSGYMLGDAISEFYSDYTKSYAPWLNAEEIEKKRVAAKRVQNKNKAEKYKRDLLAQGVSQDKAEQAATQYETALNNETQAKLRHMQDAQKRREARQTSLDSARSNFGGGNEKKKTVKCKHCGAEYPKKSIPKGSACPRCHKPKAFK